jgi:hypothetical protein
VRCIIIGWPKIDIKFYHLAPGVLQEKYDMYLPNGKRFSEGNACHHPTQLVTEGDMSKFTFIGNSLDES